MSPLQEIIPTCPNCGTELNKIKGKYGLFYGCKNYLECNFKGYPVKSEQPEPKPEVIRPEQPTRDLVLMEEIQTLSKKFEDFEAGFADKMANLKKILVLIDSKLK